MGEAPQGESSALRFVRLPGADDDPYRDIAFLGHSETHSDASVSTQPSLNLGLTRYDECPVLRRLSKHRTIDDDPAGRKFNHGTRDELFLPVRTQCRPCHQSAQENDL